jgi:hypothetical protein
VNQLTPPGQVAGTIPEARNVISGNQRRHFAHRCEQCSSGNLIGTDVTGSLTWQWGSRVVLLADISR